MNHMDEGGFCLFAFYDIWRYDHFHAGLTLGKHHVASSGVIMSKRDHRLICGYHAWTGKWE